MKLPNYIFQFNGLRFNANYLRHLFTNVAYMRMLTINDAAEFVDKITYLATMKGDVLSDNVVHLVNRNTMNLTSFGNAAFVALYHPSEMIRQEFVAIFNYMKDAY